MIVSVILPLSSVSVYLCVISVTDIYFRYLTPDLVPWALNALKY